MLKDAMNLIRTLTIRKLLNLALARVSCQLSNLLGRPVVWGRPWFVSIEPSSVCNLSCPQCPVGKGEVSRQKKFMDPAFYSGLLGEISSTTLMLSLYFQGEPFMNRNFTEFVRLAAAKRIYTQTSTNGHFLTEKVCRELVEGGLDRIIVSLDGTSRESYEGYRKKGDFGKVTEGIRTLERVRRAAGSGKPYIMVQFLVFRHNQDEIGEIKKLAAGLGADAVRVKTAQVEYPESTDRWTPDGSKYSRYEQDPSGGWKRRGRIRNRCSRLWQTAVITSDGLTVPCCFDKRATYTLGDTRMESIAEIWKNKGYQEFRKRVLSQRKEISICNNCTEGLGKIFL